MKFNSRKRAMYKGYEMRYGAVYGLDAEGYFVTNCVLEKVPERKQNNRIDRFISLVKDDRFYSMLVYRLDPRRGWFPRWECNSTTEEAYELARSCGRRNFAADLALTSAKSNRMGEVHNDHSSGSTFSFTANDTIYTNGSGRVRVVC